MLKKKWAMLGLCVFSLGLWGFSQKVYGAENDIEMLRLYNPNSGEHFYTKNEQEKVNLVQKGWQYEGIGWIAPASGDAVYRMYNPNAGDHHYTQSQAEKDNLTRLGWSYEGVGWYSAAGQDYPVYRAYNPNAKTGTHNYTIANAEQKNLIKAGWEDEAVGWYATATGTSNIGGPGFSSVEYVDADGNPLLPATSVSGLIGTTKKFAAEIIPGYQVQGASKQELTFNGTEQVLRFVYLNETALSVAQIQSNNRYLLVSSGNGNLVADLSSSGKAKLAKESATMAQKFSIRATEDGWYTLQNEATSQFLQAETSAAGASLVQGNWTGGNSQQFQFLDAGAGEVYIKSKLGGFVETTGNGLYPGENLQLGAGAMSAAQRFSLSNLSNANTLKVTRLDDRKVMVTIYSPAGNPGSVTFPTWSETNGQDDIKWIAGTKNSDGSWSAIIESKDFKDAGNFSTHVYLNGETNVGAVTYELKKPALSTIQTYATNVINQVGTDLKSVYNWSTGLKYYSYKEPASGTNLADYYALEGFTKKGGNCYVYAATFYQTAKLLGYDAHFITGLVTAARGGMTPHGWVEIVISGTTYVFDPEAQAEMKNYNGYQIRYGAPGTMQYQILTRSQGADY